MVIKHRQLLLVIILLAAVLRIAALGSKSLWFDEAFSVNRAELPQMQIWSGKHDPDHPPLYYSILHVWIGAAGESEVSIRLLSALASTLGLAVFYQLGRQLLGKDTAFTAVGLLAFSPLDIWYAQEARMYALVALTGSIYAFGLVWQHWLGVVLAGLALIVGLYVDYTMVPLWVGISAVWFVFFYKRLRKVRSLLVWLISTAVGWGFYLSWLPRLQVMLERINNVVFFDRVISMLGLPPFSASHYLVGMVGAGLGVFIVSLVFSRWLQSHKFRHIITPLILLVYASAIVLFAVPRFYSIKRILVTGWPFVILFVAWIIVNSGQRKTRIWQGLLALSLLASLITLITPKDDWRSVVGYLNNHNDAGTAIWVEPRWNRMSYDYYAPVQKARYGRLSELKEVAQDKEVWLIAERYLGQSVPSSDSESWLNEHMQLAETVSFYRLELRRYRP
jgi:uncharacterized membrane protein